MGVNPICGFTRLGGHGRSRVGFLCGRYGVSLRST